MSGQPWQPTRSGVLVFCTLSVPPAPPPPWLHTTRFVVWSRRSRIISYCQLTFDQRKCKSDQQSAGTLYLSGLPGFASAQTRPHCKPTLRGFLSSLSLSPPRSVTRQPEPVSSHKLTISGYMIVIIRLRRRSGQRPTSSGIYSYQHIYIIR